MSSLGQMLQKQLRGEIPTGPSPFVREEDVAVAIVHHSDSRVLHSPRAFQVAAFLGGALAGAFLFARNYFVLGRRFAAVLALVTGVALDAALIALANALGGMSGLLFFMSGRYLVVGIAAGELAVLFRKDYDAGIHRIASAWWVVGAIAVGCAAIGPWFVVGLLR